MKIQLTLNKLKDTTPKEKELVDPMFEESHFDSGVKAALGRIRSILESKDIPVQRLEGALKEIMMCIKENEDTVMQLEPEDIGLIVEGYKQATAIELVAAKPKKKTSAAKMLKSPDINIDEVDF